MKTETMAVIEDALTLRVVAKAADLAYFDKSTGFAKQDRGLIRSYLMFRVMEAEDALADWRDQDFGA